MAVRVYWSFLSCGLKKSLFTECVILTAPPNVATHLCWIHSALHSIIDILLIVLQMKETIMNPEKLAKLQAQVRIGGKVREC